MTREYRRTIYGILIFQQKKSDTLQDLEFKRIRKIDYQCFLRPAQQNICRRMWDISSKLVQNDFWIIQVSEINESQVQVQKINQYDLIIQYFTAFHYLTGQTLKKRKKKLVKA